jgi:protease I
MKIKIAKYLLCMVAVLGLTSSSFGQQTKTIKVLMIIANSEFRDEEFYEPKAIFEKANFELTVASNKGGECTSTMGAKVKSDILLKDVIVDNYDAIVFVGGEGSRKYFSDPMAQKIVLDATSKGKVIAAICVAPNILANAGILKGKNATCFGSTNLKAKGANFIAKPVVRDGKIITGMGLWASTELGNTIVSALKE